MKKIRFGNSLVLAPMLALAFSSLASAQATRTWVSGVGDDANPCSRTAPCKTWAGAISKTSAGGEIDALDPGGFGALTITKAITLDGGGGQVASVLVAGTNGINVAAGAADIVTLRNIRLNGLAPNNGSPGLIGVSIVSAGAVHLENVFIFGFATFGVDVSASASINVTLQDTTITNGSTTGGGVSATTSSGIVNVDITNSRIHDVRPGLQARNNSVWQVSHSDISDDGVAVKAFEAGATVNLTDCQLNNNTTAVQSISGSTIRIMQSSMSQNGTALSPNGGTLLSDGLNNVNGNGSNGSITGGTTHM